MVQKISKAEKETILRFSEDVEEPMTFETFNKRRALRLIERGANCIRTTVLGGATVAWTLEMPRKWFRWPGPPRVVAKTGVVPEALRKAAK